MINNPPHLINIYFSINCWRRFISDTLTALQSYFTCTSGKISLILKSLNFGTRMDRKNIVSNKQNLPSKGLLLLRSDHSIAGLLNLASGQFELLDEKIMLSRL